MIKPTPAPKVKYPRLLVVPYAYAVCLVALTLIQLVGMGGLSFGSFEYTTPGAPSLIILLVVLQILALPFVLRLPLSPLARFFSAKFTLAAPLVLFGSFIAIDMSTRTLDSPDILLSMGYVALGMASFWVLGGQEALRLSKK